MSYLESLFTKYGTDKGIWGYTPAYEKHLMPMIGAPRNVLEIGICGYRDIPNNVVGASLYCWRDYFPNSNIFGIDNDMKFMVDVPAIAAHARGYIKSACANAYNVDSLAAAIKSFGPRQFDFICDDAVHDPVPQLHLLQQLWPLVKSGGIYAVEEMCPYKLPDNDESIFAGLALAVAPHAQLTIYQTPKDERLVILVKP